MRIFIYLSNLFIVIFSNFLTDCVPKKNRFRTFTLRKTNELVGYALDGIKAPSLNRHSGKHLEAIDYHKHMEQKDTVIIDVRNAYESDIGTFKFPSHTFPG